MDVQAMIMTPLILLIWAFYILNKRGIMKLHAGRQVDSRSEWSNESSGIKPLLLQVNGLLLISDWMVEIRNVEEDFKD